jgi:site-specific recombinase XerD
MLDHYFKRSRQIRSLREGPFGTLLDEFLDHLYAAGYSTDRARCSTHDVVHLGTWLRCRRIPISALDEAVIERFTAHLPECHCTGARLTNHCRVRFRLIGFLGHLRQIGTVPMAQRRVTPVQKLVDGYCAWMRERGGVVDSTLSRRKPLLTDFINEIGVRTRCYSAASVRAFILGYAREREPSAKNITTCVRSFLRYLAAHGECRADLPDAVPCVPSARLAPLPVYLEPTQIERVIRACPADVVGLRDRAMLSLFARLGLRPSDVVQARLGDLDWQRGRIRLVGKSRREAWLPLPQDVGDAISAYVDRRRSGTEHDHVFLATRAPFGPLGRTAVNRRVEVALRRVGISLPRGGPYLFRHSLAMRLLGNDATLDQIGAVLRHRNIETTAIYAKVDKSALGGVTQPWPTAKGQSC